MSILAILPARGGSKRIPKKNIKPFLGKPILSYPLEVALESRIFDEVMVSTDDLEIKEVATALGAKVPFLRSPENSSDLAGTLAVLREVLTAYQSRGQVFDFFCCIYPTTPLLGVEILTEAFKKFRASESDFLMPVCRYSTPIQRSLQMQSGLVTMVEPGNFSKRSQDLEPRFFDPGQFYFGTTEALFKYSHFYLGKTVGFEMDEVYVQDIDNEQDWLLAEMKYNYLKQSKTC